MRPSTESIGVFFSFEDIGNASLAQEVAFNSMGEDRSPEPLDGTEILFPVLHEGEEVLLDSRDTEKIITLAHLACSASDQRSYNAHNRYLSLKHNWADDDSLMAASLEDRLEAEYTEVFRGLSEEARACITASADVAIERGLNRQSSATL